MARVSVTRIRQAAGAACTKEPNPSACKRGVALAIQAYQVEKKKKKRKVSPAQLKRLRARVACTKAAGVPPFTAHTATQKRDIAACMERKEY